MAFWTKKNTPTTSTVNEQVRAELTSLEAIPSDIELIPIIPEKGGCQKIQVGPDTTTFSETEDAFALGPGFGYLLPKDLAVTNDSNTAKVKIWEVVDRNSTASLNPIAGPEIHPDQEKWTDSTVVDSLCLSDDLALLVIQYFQDGVKNGRFLFDSNTRKFEELGLIESHTRDTMRYLFRLSLSDDSTLVMHQSDKKRKSAEIYHNYYQHLTLYSPNYPSGLNLLTLGIDDGNIRNWAFADTTLYVQTEDNRITKEIKNAYWSLDLAQVMKE